MSANDTQVGGDHYKNQKVQPWDFIVSNGLGYLEGCVIKYVSRHALKGGRTDLLKAQHYLAKLIEQSEPEGFWEQMDAHAQVEAAAAAVKPVAIVKTPTGLTGVRRRGRPPGIKSKRKVTK